MLQESLEYPASGDDAVKTLLIGGILTLASVLLLPVIVVLGYLVRVLRTTIDGEEEPPVFEDWEALLVDGLKATGVALAYFAVPVIVSILLAVSVLFTVSTTVVVSEAGDVVAEPAAVAGGGLIVLLFLVGTIFSVFWSLAAAYVLPASLARLATTDRIGAAFQFREIWTTVKTGGYAVPWLLALAVSIAAGFVVGVVSLIPAIGAVAVAFVYFYTNVVAFRLYGEGVVRATPVETVPETETSKPAI
jgi:hypothetical protein